ncbi:MAG: fibronectin type III domain-containing protein, partial [Candidatus Thermoplasmatota archaeon]|nr:fibronectin type III domain-containing protein [Candidatus Thermoplasmatota archaeon]
LAERFGDNSDWSDRNMEIGLDQDAPGGDSTARQNGVDKPGELMIRIILGPGTPSDAGQVAQATSTSYVDSGLTSNESYTYQITAVTTVGEGPPSDPVTRVLKFTAPSAPKETSAQPTAPGEITVNWTAPGNDGGHPVTHYNVYRGDPSSELTLLRTTTNTSGYIDRGLPRDTTFHYQVTANNSEGEGEGSPVVQATTPTYPGPPGDTWATPGPEAHQITLSWLEPTNDGRSPITAYRIYRAAQGEDPTLLATSTDLEHVDTGLPNGTRYTYHVTAVNGVGEGIEGPSAQATSPYTPSEPRSPATEPGPARGEVTLDWALPEDDGGVPIQAWEIHRGTGPEDLALHVQLANDPATPTTTYIDQSLRDGATYTYAVRAVNDVGPGTLSANVQGTAPVQPDAPSGLDADRGPGPGEITVSWTPPDDDGGLPVTSYRIYEGTTGGTLLEEVGPSSRSWTHSGIANGATKTYRVSAVNEVGESPSTPAIQASAPDVPGEPLDPSALPGPEVGQVTVTWETPLDDGGLPITGYRIYRGTDAGSLSELAQVGVTKEFLDETVDQGSTYTYQIHALNEAGEGVGSAIAETPAPAFPSRVRDLAIERGPGAGELTLTWTEPADPGGSTIQGYRIYRSMDGEGPAFRAEVGDVASFTDGGLAEGEEATYWVTAFNLDGESNLPEPVSERAPTRPGAPTDLRKYAGPGSGVTTIRWTAPEDTGGIALDGYSIYRADVPGDWRLIGQVPPGKTHYADDGTYLILPTPHYYRVEAVNDVGAGPPSETVCAAAPPYGIMDNLYSLYCDDLPKMNPPAAWEGQGSPGAHRGAGSTRAT